MKKDFIKHSLVVGLASLPALSFAAAPDLTTLTASVDFSTVSDAVLAVGATGVGMLLAWVAVKYVRRVVRSS